MSRVGYWMRGGLGQRRDNSWPFSPYREAAGLKVSKTPDCALRGGAAGIKVTKNPWLCSPRSGCRYKVYCRAAPSISGLFSLWTYRGVAAGVKVYSGVIRLFPAVVSTDSLIFLVFLARYIFLVVLGKYGTYMRYANVFFYFYVFLLLCMRCTEVLLCFHSMYFPVPQCSQRQNLSLEHSNQFLQISFQRRIALPNL